MTARTPNSDVEQFPDDIHGSYNPVETHFGAAAAPAHQDETESGHTPRPGDTYQPLGEDDETPSRRPRAYRASRVIGTGGCGEVWEAIQSSLSRVVALKRVRLDVLRKHPNPEDRHLLERLIRHEAVTTSNLEHPAIVPIYDLGHDSGGLPQFAMKKLRGRSWEKVLEEDAEQLAREQYLLKHLGILMQVVQAVAFAHSRGVVHRDLKPAQVMIGDFGEVTVMDWGLAVVFDGEMFVREAGAAAWEVVPKLEHASSPAGTLSYMAPEQMSKSAAGVGPWTDVYLLGGCLYYLLALRAPHDDTSKARCVEKARTGFVNPLKLRAFEGEAPSALADLVRRAMDPEPTFRPASAQEFLRDLQVFLSGQGRLQEAEIVLDSVEASLADPAKLNYHEFATAVARLQQAAGLAPGNQRIPRIAARLYEAFAEYALAHNDMRLAEVQAEFIPAGPSRDAILQRVEDGRRREALEARTRRQALLLSGVLVFLLILASGVFAAYTARLGRMAERDREAAISESVAAGEARLHTEDLLDFMVNELGDSLATGEPDPDAMRRLAEEVVDYYGYTAGRPEDPEKALLYARRLNRAAELQSDLGEHEAAERAHRRALTLTEALVSAGVPEGPQEHARTLDLLAGALDQLGRPDEAAEQRAKAALARSR